MKAEPDSRERRQSVLDTEVKRMINGIIGRKIGMTQLFAEDGTVTPVTVIKAGPCVIVTA